MMGGTVSGGDFGKLNVIHCEPQPAVHRVLNRMIQTLCRDRNGNTV